ncbi:DoxX family protein, partial [Balneolaceae bacterium ANBcel3]|nr:DoxX family protein [Balneolaceae bacterium ANBcel3]
EFVGGILVLAGAYIRVPAFLLAFIMVVAILTTKLGQDFNAYRLDIMLLVASLALGFMGSGTYSVDDKIKKES